MRVEMEMEKIVALEYPQPFPKERPTVGSCYGHPVGGLIKKSVVLPRVRALITGNALPCYLATYLGCDAGEWIGDSSTYGDGPAGKPFTRSKVTIVEQTPDRVVADVGEAAAEGVQHGVLGDWDDLAGTYVPYTGDLKGPDQRSRFTLSRGADGVWRISDRRPSFDWECRPN